MGMDQYIDAIKYDLNDKTKIIERKELVYWRKFYDLNRSLHYYDDMYAKDLPLTKEEVESILQFVSHNRDYFDGFQTVPDVCEVLDQYDELKEDGWNIVYNANWQVIKHVQIIQRQIPLLFARH